MQPVNLNTKTVDIDSTEESLHEGRNPPLWRRLSQRLTPPFVRNAKAIFRESGFRGVVRAYGWKTLAAIFFYYLTRDVILYILIPYWLAKGLF